jgi:CRISPR-associated protein Csd1
MTGELIRAVLNNQPYPASFLSSVLLRIHADKVMNRERAAIIKAYYIMNPQHISKEVLTVSLNKEANDPGYNLGRLFAVLEAIQRTALPNIKSTIRDKFFVSAATTPQNVFSSLLKFYTTHHLKVIGRESFALRVYYEKLLNELSNKFETGFPTQLDLPQQGAFQLGYYHQRQEIYKPADTSTAPADASPIGTSQS